MNDEWMVKWTTRWDCIIIIKIIDVFNCLRFDWNNMYVYDVIL